MNIALVSHDKYTYQYELTGYLTLRCLEDEPVVLAEPAGREDALLEFSVDTVEVQIKGEKPDLSLEKLALWLLHFPERGDTNTLFERLGTTENSALFLVAARTTDDSRAFVIEQGGKIPVPRRLSVPKSGLRAARDALIAAAATLGDEKLDGRRKAHLASMLSKLSDQELEMRLCKVHVIDQLTEGAVRDILPQHLRRAHRVPEACASALVGEIVQAVKEAIRDRGNLTPRVAALVAKYVPGLLYVTPDRVPRSEPEERVRESLETNYLALLTGVPMSGKTDIATYIGRECQDAGFEPLETDSLQEARRWLNEAVAGARLAIVHDPFGSSSLRTDADVTERILADLIRQLRPTRKLIVTTRTEILQQLGQASSLTTPAGAPLSWVDTTLASSDQRVSFWLALSTNRSQQERDNVAGALRDQNSWCASQPGHLTRLARLESIGSLDGVSLYKLGNQTAREVANAIGSDADQARVLTALYLTAGMTGSSTSSLASSLGEYHDLGSLRPESGAYSVSVNRPPPVPPSGPELRELSDMNKTALQALESAGLVVSQSDGTLRLAHPEYEVAAGLLLQRLFKTEASRVRGVVRAAITSLVPSVARQAIRALEQTALRKHLELKDWLPELLLGCRAVQPIVADDAVSSLLKHYRQFTRGQQAEILGVVQAHKRASEWIFWSNGNAFYDTREERSFDLGLEPLDELVVARLSSDSEALQPQELFTMLKKRQLQELDPYARERLVKLGMASRLAVVRALSAKVLAANPGGNEELLLRAVTDEHPRVVAGAVEGLLKSWVSLEESSQHSVLERLRETLLPPHAAAILDDVLLTYERAEVPARQGEASWELWLEVAAMGLRELPKTFVNTGRLYTFGEAAIRASSFRAAQRFLTAWLDWLLRMAKTSYPDEYALSVLDLVPHGYSTLLADLGKRMLSEGSTCLRFTAVRDLVDRWSELDQAIRDHLKEEFAGDGDARWLRAVALTRRAVPDELERMLLPKQCTVTSSPASFVSCCPEELLSDALSVYCGHPQPLWWLGAHHSDEERWRPIILEILAEPTHPLWKLAVREVLNSRERSSDVILTDAIAAAGVDTFEVVATELLRLTACNVGNRGAELWSALATRAEELDKTEEVVEDVLKVLEQVDLCDNFGDIVGAGKLGTSVIQRLDGDSFVRTLVQLPQDSLVTDEARANLQRLLENVYDKCAPRLRRSHELACQLLTAVGYPQGALEALRKRWEAPRSNLLEQQRATIDDHYELSHWIQP